LRIARPGGLGQGDHLIIGWGSTRPQRTRAAPASQRRLPSRSIPTRFWFLLRSDGSDERWPSPGVKISRAGEAGQGSTAFG